MGIEVVEVLAANAGALPPLVAITATRRRTKSVASAGSRSICILRPVVLNQNVLALDISGVVQALAKSAQTVRVCVRRRGIEQSNHRHRREQSRITSAMKITTARAAAPSCSSRVMAPLPASPTPSRHPNSPVRAARTQDRSIPAPTGARHHDAGRQGDVSDDGRVCRVRARLIQGTRPRRACERQERGEASWSASDSRCAGETNPRGSGDS